MDAAGDHPDPPLRGFMEQAPQSCFPRCSLRFRPAVWRRFFSAARSSGRGPVLAPAPDCPPADSRLGRGCQLPCLFTTAIFLLPFRGPYFRDFRVPRASARARPGTAEGFRDKAGGGLGCPVRGPDGRSRRSSATVLRAGGMPAQQHIRIRTAPRLASQLPTCRRAVAGASRVNGALPVAVRARRAARTSCPGRGNVCRGDLGCGAEGGAACPQRAVQNLLETSTGELETCGRSGPHDWHDREEGVRRRVRSVTDAAAGQGRPPEAAGAAPAGRTCRSSGRGQLRSSLPACGMPGRKRRWRMPEVCPGIAADGGYGDGRDGRCRTGSPGRNGTAMPPRRIGRNMPELSGRNVPV
jgi:hypothetical protein